ncbi:hypothetical protein GDO78_018596 [Eleutherodactylus coqui]|uniref:Uncharacterized protein n=1 Tax=Eleutherodactylus coqui TaxID=57060 RepID=A0A8J6BLP1_ELECQ|nr:hypothetical protein GDO78_018596 [Eleutherodactylus coqui]
MSQCPCVLVVSINPKLRMLMASFKAYLSFQHVFSLLSHLLLFAPCFTSVSSDLQGGRSHFSVALLFLIHYQ